MGKNQNMEFGSEARTQLINGIGKLSNTVISTLGPSGRNVIYLKNGEVFTTKDGVSAAKSIGSLEDPIEDLGMKMIKQASIKTSIDAGDGTTTSTLLAKEMIMAGVQHLNNNSNAVEIKRGIDTAVKEVISCLRENIAQDISDENQLEQVASISANNDPEVGKLVSTAIQKVGKDGVVTIEESKTGETYLETVEGMQFDRGYKSHYLVTDNNTMSTTLEDPYILIINSKITTAKELLPILEGVSTRNKSLLIIAEDIDNEALATLIVNKARGTIKVAAVKAPDFGDRRKLILEDIAILTGGKVLDKDKGMKLDKFNWEWFGEARSITITKDQTTIVDGKGSEEEIGERVDSLQSLIDKAQTPFEVENLQNRLAKMIGGVSIIHVGGYTETEMNEKKDRVDDALNATKAALEEGILPGGGAALLYARNNITLDNLGAEIVHKACGKPFEQILINAGYDSTAAQMIGKYQLVESGDDSWTGYNLKTEKVTNMKEAGIIDPAKVTRVALESAASVAGNVLLTEAVVYDLPSNESEADPMMGMPGMGGMM